MSNRLPVQYQSEAPAHAEAARVAVRKRDSVAARLHAQFAGIAAARSCGLGMALTRADTPKEIAAAWDLWRDPFSPSEAGLSRCAHEGAEMWLRHYQGQASRRDVAVMRARGRSFAELSQPREE